MQFTCSPPHPLTRSRTGDRPRAIPGSLSLAICTIGGRYVARGGPSPPSSPYRGDATTPLVHRRGRAASPPRYQADDAAVALPVARSAQTQRRRPVLPGDVVALAKGAERLMVLTNCASLSDDERYPCKGAIIRQQSR